MNIDLVKEHEDDVKLASLYKFNLIDKTNDEETLDQDVKRKKLENESIFENKMKFESPNSSIASQSASNKSNNINSLRRKLTKSIQEKKLNEICNTNVSIKKDLLFSCKKKTDESNNKLPNIAIKEQNATQVGLVSTDYGDDDSDE